MNAEEDKHFLKIAANLAIQNVKENKGGPFGAIVVKNGEIISSGCNCVSSSNDPTAHAEITAIRNACEKLKSFQLTDCTIYSTCEPCPMCLGAIYWARPQRLVFASTKKDAAKIGFDDDFIYQEINLPFENRRISTSQIDITEAQELFKLWENKGDKVEY
ncbi:MAG: nucleoside deaminase [Cytophagaceae bacterium]|nr:nucleoside deaminase [Cytophagaceae bacterium]MBK9936409.1 nucleoside deaminase [Cytophagaceae bacterium]MBL0300158.1 nucleoside deaminase [Cytophagaceae bacterium]MBL0327095.1 nucleoside deaminase [Cytophagaceae bacterium]